MLLLLSVAITAAQSDMDAQCTQLLEKVFRDLGTNCAAAESNTVCYGSPSIVDPLFTDGQEIFPDDGQVFSEPGDIVDLVFPQEDFYSVAALGVSPLSLEDEAYGVSLIYTQANLPTTVDPVVIGLFGNVRIENGVFEDELFLPGEEITVSLSEAVLFTAPDSVDEPHLAIEQVSGTFVADAVTPDGSWVRIQYEYERELGASRAAAWVSAEDLAADVDTSVLPVLGPDSLSPMQEFYIISDSGDEDTGCETAPPSGVLLQGPENIESDVLINGVHVRISSTVFVQMVDGVLHFTTLSGLVVLEPNTDHEVIVPPGFTVEFGISGDLAACFGDFVNLGLDMIANNGVANFGTCSFSEPGVISEAEATAFTSFEALPENVINYQITIIIIAPGPSGIGGPTVIIILGAEDLSRIKALCSGDNPLLSSDICEVFDL
ncbi:MAG: hypothetical protein CL607_12260 [Anaerolineaceae bacterium]|nr:hypothetical protein [Anaerolineaceae bacterium]